MIMHFSIERDDSGEWHIYLPWYIPLTVGVLGYGFFIWVVAKFGRW